MKLHQILKAIEKEQFQKHLVYSFVPVVCFEFSNYCYINNPLLKKLRITTIPKFFVIHNTGYEGWNNGQIQKITNRKDIEFVIKESRQTIKSGESKITKILKQDFDKLSNQEIINILNLKNDIIMKVYQRDIFFLDEYFETSAKDLIRLLPKVRIEMSEFVDKLNQIDSKIIDAVYYRFEEKIPWKTFVYATSGEITDLLKQPKTAKQFKKIKGRKLVFFFDGKNLATIKNQSEIKEITHCLKKQQGRSKKEKEFKGMVAFQGKPAKAKVIIVSAKNYQHISKILKDKKDFVLVTPMTRPEFVPYLKNAKAIITDEGGITCHAAIVARELKIPCIVGTKIATSILKNGDLVEVNTTTGTIQII